MYGIVSVVFVIITSLIYYEAATYNQSPFITNEIELSRYMVSQNQRIFGTCINRNLMPNDAMKQVKLKSHSQNTFAVLLERNPLIRCQELAYAFSVTEKRNRNKLDLDDVAPLKAIIGQHEIISLQADVFLKVRNSQLFILVLGVQLGQISQENSKESRTITLDIQRYFYSQSFLKPLMWFSCFNLIGISLITYYSNNVFNAKTKPLPTISLLVYLIWIGFDSPSPLEQVQQKIKLAMNCFILIICIKNQLTTCQTSFILGFSLLNQITLDYFRHKTDQNYPLMLWLIYALNFINGSFITLGQNIEVVYFSIFGFVVGYGLVNQSVDIMHPLMLSLILVTLVLGPTIYELLQLKENFSGQERKTKQRLQSYQVCQSDTLFRN